MDVRLQEEAQALLDDYEGRRLSTMHEARRLLERVGEAPAPTPMPPERVLLFERAEEERRRREALAREREAIARIPLDVPPPPEVAIARYMRREFVPARPTARQQIEAFLQEMGTAAAAGTFDMLQVVDLPRQATQSLVVAAIEGREPAKVVEESMAFLPVSPIGMEIGEKIPTKEDTGVRLAKLLGVNTDAPGAIIPVLALNIAFDPFVALAGGKKAISAVVDAVGRGMTKKAVNAATDVIRLVDKRIGAMPLEHIRGIADDTARKMRVSPEALAYYKRLSPEEIRELTRRILPDLVERAKQVAKDVPDVPFGVDLPAVTTPEELVARGISPQSIKRVAEVLRITPEEAAARWTKPEFADDIIRTVSEPSPIPVLAKEDLIPHSPLARRVLGVEPPVKPLTTPEGVTVLPKPRLIIPGEERVRVSDEFLKWVKEQPPTVTEYILATETPDMVARVAAFMTDLPTMAKAREIMREAFEMGYSEPLSLYARAVGRIFDMPSVEAMERVRKKVVTLVKEGERFPVLTKEATHRWTTIARGIEEGEIVSIHDFLPPADMAAIGRMLEITPNEARYLVATRMVEIAREMKAREIPPGFENLLRAMLADRPGPPPLLPEDVARIAAPPVIPDEVAPALRYPIEAVRRDAEVAMRMGARIARDAHAQAGPAVVLPDPPVLPETSLTVKRILEHPAVERIGRMIGKKMRPGVDPLEWIETQLFDRWAPIRNLVNRIRIAGAKILEEEDPYTTLVVLAGRWGQVLAGRKELEALLQPVRGNRKLFTRYLIAQRAIERSERGLMNPAGVTADEAKAALSVMRQDPHTYTILESTARDFYDWAGREILERAEDAELLAPGMAEEILRENRRWVPFSILEHLPDEIDELTPGAEWISVSKQEVVHKMRGTEKMMEDPFVAVFRRHALAVGQAERNKAALALARLADEHPEESAGKIIPAKRVSYRTAEGVRVTRWESPPENFGFFNVMKEGKAHRYFVPRSVALALKYTSGVELKMLGRYLMASSEMFRAGATMFYLPFVVTNAFRDFFMAKFVSKYGLDMRAWIRNFYRSLKYELGWDDPLITRYYKSGAGFAGPLEHVLGPRDPAYEVEKLFRTRLQRILRPKAIITSPFTLTRVISQAVERAPRLAIFERSLAKGDPLIMAAFYSRAGTVDFGKGGAFIKTINLFVPFLKARIEAKVGLVRAGIRNPGHAAVTALKWCVLPGMAAYAWNRHYYNDLYDDIPYQIRQDYFTIIYGETLDEYGRRVPQFISIPKGDVGQIFWNPIELGLDYVARKNPRSIASLVVDWIDNVSPVTFARRGEASLARVASGITPPFIRTAGELMSGYDWYTGIPLVPRRLLDASPEDQYTHRTQAAYIWLSKLLAHTGARVSPIKLQHAAGSLFAGVGRGLGDVPSDPLVFLSLTLERFARARGGEREQLAYEFTDEATKGYTATRIKIERLFAEEKIHEGIALACAWNDLVKQSWDKMGEVGFPPDAGFRLQTTFQQSDVLRLLYDVLAKKGEPHERKILEWTLPEGADDLLHRPRRMRARVPRPRAER